MKKFIFLMLLFSFSTPSLVVFADEPEQTEALEEINSDLSKESKRYTEPQEGKKHYLIAIGNMFLDNGLIYAYDRWIEKAGFSYVTADSIKRNFTAGMEWDRDILPLNFFAHPLQGNLYYTGARAANLNQLESFLVTFAGSAIWEWFGENELPSKNDMICTTIGAFAVGEMLYRLALEGDEISRLLGLCIAPSKAIVELATRERAKHRTGNIYGFSFNFGAGTSRGYSKQTNSNHNFSDIETFPAFLDVAFDINYNDPYGWESNVPYSQFDFLLSGSIGFGSGYGYQKKNLLFDLTIRSTGIIFSRALEIADNIDTTLGMVLDYDLTWHSFFEFSALSPGFVIKQRFRNPKGSKIEWQGHLDWLMIGATDNFRYRRDLLQPGEKMREYSYTTGLQTVLSWKRIGVNKHIIDLDFHGYLMRSFTLFDDCTIPGKGLELLGFFKANYEIPLTEKVYLVFGNQLYLKKSFYDEFPEIFQAMYSGRVFARLKLK